MKYDSQSHSTTRKKETCDNVHFSQVYQIPQETTSCYDQLQESVYLKPPTIDHSSLYVCSNPSCKEERSM